MSKESIPDGRKAVSQLRILVLRQVHIIDQEEPPLVERGDRFAKFEDLPARGIGEDQVGRSERSDKVGPVPSTIETQSGQPTRFVASAIAGSSSTLTTSTSVLDPMQWTIQERPTPKPAPISRILPPMGTELARQDTSSPTSGSEESSKPDWLARNCALETESGMSTNTTVSELGRSPSSLKRSRCAC
jgi:hypothetical protein